MHEAKLNPNTSHNWLVFKSVGDNIWIMSRHVINGFFGFVDIILGPGGNSHRYDGPYSLEKPLHGVFVVDRFFDLL